MTLRKKEEWKSIILGINLYREDRKIPSIRLNRKTKIHSVVFAFWKRSLATWFPPRGFSLLCARVLFLQSAKTNVASFYKRVGWINRFVQRQKELLKEKSEKMKSKSFNLEANEQNWFCDSRKSFHVVSCKPNHVHTKANHKTSAEKYESVRKTTSKIHCTSLIPWDSVAKLLRNDNTKSYE